MLNIRKSAVAGLFYPDVPQELESSVDQFLLNARASDVIPRAIIVPHAGYIYSAQIAAQAYKTLVPLRNKIKRIILAGPSHRVPFYGCALSSAEYYATPLGNIPLDQAANLALIEAGYAKILDAAHAQEHSIEVHLPFLLRALGTFNLVPIVVGEANPDEVARLFDYFWHDTESIYVISSDLSHFHPYNEAKEIDAATSQSIMQRDSESIGPEQACGCRPLNGLLTLARKYDLSIKILDVCNSGDTAGDKSRVVGYGAYVVY